MFTKLVIITTDYPAIFYSVILHHLTVDLDFLMLKFTVQ